MNENIDLTKILKDCRIGTKLYSTIHGCVILRDVLDNMTYPIVIECENGILESYTSEGKIFNRKCGECILFPSKDQRDWSKFKIAKPKFDPKTLQPFDRVLVKDRYCKWSVSLFLGYNSEKKYSVCCNYSFWEYCIPYNDETKHLVGTTDEAPEYYRYWEE